MEPFDFQLYSSWGIPDFSPEPLPETVPVSPERFLQGVEETVAKDGVWKATGEYKMGGVIKVEITPSNAQGVPSYRATAAFGRLVGVGEYDTLEHALRALPLIAYSLCDVREKGGWKGLVGG
jgi:hypothetical protein